MEQHRTFNAFWPVYLRAHSNPLCRRLHYIGSTGALVALLIAIAELNPLWLVGGLAFAYGLAWIGHFAFERNRPATFGNPVWSLVGDVRMYILWLTGRLEESRRIAEEQSREPGGLRPTGG